MPKNSREANIHDLAPDYEPTEHERTALKAFFARDEQCPPAPPMKVVERDGEKAFDIDHPNAVVAQVLLMEALGTRDRSFLNGLLRQLANAGTQDQNLDASALNFMLSVVKGIQPRDQVEAMLAAQMAAVHMATMTFARRVAHETIPGQNSAERAFNKLARTFAMQLEALKRYRSKGEQKMTVEHLHVHSGAQAVVGMVETPGRAAQVTSEEQHHARQIAHAFEPSMRSADEGREPMQIASDAERPLPNARGKVTRRSEG
jgi:hypothetical protein